MVIGGLSDSLLELTRFLEPDGLDSIVRLVGGVLWGDGYYEAVRKLNLEKVETDLQLEDHPVLVRRVLRSA